MSNELNKKAILAYRLKNAWQQSSKGDITDEQITNIQQQATPEEAQILNAPISVVDLMEFLVSDTDDIEEAMIASLEDSGEEDCTAVINECAKPLDLFARAAPELFQSFAAQLSSQDRSDVVVLRDVAPNFVTALNI